MMQVQGLPKITASLIPQTRATRTAWLAVLLLSAALLLLPLLVKLDGRPHADWQQFLGRFHPLAVHIPIGLLVLIPVLEIAGRFRSALREAAGFVLPLACATSLGSLALGVLLAYGSGDTGTTLTRHMWGGIALSITLLLCMLTRTAWTTGSRPHIYPWLLTFSMFALLWTAHMGGSITHGDDYLTTFMPAPLKAWFPASMHRATAASPDSFYAQQVHPILDSNCASCHGASKTQGGLRLDSYDLLMKGGKDGPVIIARDAPRSLLLTRVTLPANDPHFMPSDGHTPLKTEHISLLRAWIEQGASPTVPSLAGINLPGPSAGASEEPVGDYSALLPEIQIMEQLQGAKLVPVSANPADGLILSTVNIAPTFTDAQLASFAKFAPFIVEADLARTAVTDGSFDTLRKFTHLRALHLEGTAITGQGLGKLTTLSRLRYLNLSGTKVDSSSVAPIHSMANLQRVYLFDTPAEMAAK